MAFGINAIAQGPVNDQNRSGPGGINPGDVVAVSPHGIINHFRRQNGSWYHREIHPGIASHLTNQQIINSIIRNTSPLTPAQIAWEKSTGGYVSNITDALGKGIMY